MKTTPEVEGLIDSFVKKTTGMKPQTKPEAKPFNEQADYIVPGAVPADLAKHTPGPWISPRNHELGASTDYAITTMHGDFEVIAPHVYNEANARLIAKAPEMAELLEECKTVLNRLTVACGEADALQHAGLNVPAKVWSEIYQVNNEAKQLLAKLEK